VKREAEAARGVGGGAEAAYVGGWSAGAACGADGGARATRGAGWGAEAAFAEATGSEVPAIEEG
jgi:hypothetical protein